MLQVFAWVFNLQKSVLQHSPFLEYLGLILDRTQVNLPFKDPMDPLEPKG